MLTLHLVGGGKVLIYPMENHEPGPPRFGTR